MQKWMVRQAVKVKIKRKRPKTVFLTGWEYVNLRLGAGLVQSRIKDLVIQFLDLSVGCVCVCVCVCVFEMC